MSDGKLIGMQIGIWKTATEVAASPLVPAFVASGLALFGVTFGLAALARVLGVTLFVPAVVPAIVVAMNHRTARCRNKEGCEKQQQKNAFEILAQGNIN
jgi:hypothetical protein